MLFTDACAAVVLPETWYPERTGAWVAEGSRFTIPKTPRQHPCRLNAAERASEKSDPLGYGAGEVPMTLRELQSASKNAGVTPWVIRSAF